MIAEMVWHAVFRIPPLAGLVRCWLRRQILIERQRQQELRDLLVASGELVDPSAPLPVFQLLHARYPLVRQRQERAAMTKPYQDTNWDERYHNTLYGPDATERAGQRAAHDVTGPPAPDAASVPPSGVRPLLGRDVVPSDSWRAGDQ
jgi:hypothetical protein